MARRVLVLAFALVATLAAPALAEDTYHVEGEADVNAADPRVAALDVAFAAATREALRDHVAAADLKARKTELDREVIGRARKWVASYKVTADATEGDTRKLTVDVRIDPDKLLARLGELGVAVIAAVEPDPGTEPTGPSTGLRATVLLRFDSPRRTSASYGASAERDVPGLAAVSAAVRAAGYQLVPAPAAGPAPQKGDELLGDDSARALAGSAGADVAVVVGVETTALGPVRGTSDRGVLARARVRIVGQDASDGTAVGGAHGATEDLGDTAAAAAAVDAFLDARPAGAAAVAPGPVASVTAGADEILVAITGRDRKDGAAWSVVRAIKDKLATTKGAEITFRRVAAREVVLSVKGGGRAADKLARDIRDLEHKLSGTTVSTKVDGNNVQVRVSGSP
jgi:hypothetical protein